MLLLGQCQALGGSKSAIPRNEELGPFISIYNRAFSLSGLVTDLLLFHKDAMREFADQLRLLCQTQ